MDILAFERSTRGWLLQRAARLRSAVALKESVLQNSRSRCYPAYRSGQTLTEQSMPVGPRAAPQSIRYARVHRFAASSFCRLAAHAFQFRPPDKDHRCSYFQEPDPEATKTAILEKFVGRLFGRGASSETEHS